MRALPSRKPANLERASVIAWMMLRRRDAQKIPSAEMMGAALAVLDCLIEEIAGGKHEGLNLAILADDPPSVH